MIKGYTMDELQEMCHPRSRWAITEARRRGIAIHDMEDIAQSAAVNSLSRKSRHPIISRSAYIRQIAHRCTIDHLRSRKKCSERLCSDTVDPVADQRCGQGSTADADLRIDLAAAITHLPPDQAAVIRRYLAGESVHRIAIALGISEEAVRKRKSRACKTLREELRDWER
ncbi:MAG: sigma-70 family RNA polymerase sigma factor [Pirellulaceae bacterium]|nr:sigma-70 family RNA polymerase sigma factor [Pirellulaceae bacterium]